MTQAVSGVSVGADHPFLQTVANDPSGLSAAEVRSRRQVHGANVFRSEHPYSAWLQFVSRFKNPLVVILLVASVVSAFSGEITNFVIISAIVLMSVTLDFVQEYRAQLAVDQLRQSVSVRCTVIREGRRQEVSVNDLVPGDWVLVSAGDLIPADAWVIDAKDFFVNQSILTGEAYPVEKHPVDPIRSNSDNLEEPCAVFMGTSVIGGSARLLIVKTGKATAIGDIAESLGKPKAATSFEVGTRQFGNLIMWLTVVMVLFVLLVNAWFHKPWLESFLFAVALAVGLTPELLPMVVSVTLAKGAMRLSKMKMIVKRPSAVQDLGSMDVLCTDKTGTLTEAKIHLERHLSPQGADSTRVLELAYLNSYFETGLKSPLDEAILAHQSIAVDSWKKVDEIPFSFERRCVSVLLDDGAQRLLIVKGAAEDILRLCTNYEDTDGAVVSAIGEAEREHIASQYQALEADGLRVLGIAWRKVPREHLLAEVTDESELIFAGFAAFLDPPKESAGVALAMLQSSGVTIKIVTGDSHWVTQHVCKQLGIPVLGVLTGQEINQLDEHALVQRVLKANLFCRVNPAQKQRVIMALKAAGHVVGYMGDGINDAPSLHAADVGLSVDSAVDVAKAAADIILMQADLKLLHAGVIEGRRTFGNIMKYMMMGTSSNFGNMFSMAGAALFLPFLPMMPTQILLNNILYDVSEIPIPLDKVDDQETTQPRTIDLRLIRNFMLVVGPISSAFDFLTFYLLLQLMNAHERLFQTGWFIESLCTQVLVIFVIRTHGNPFKSRPHPLLALTSIGVVLIAIFLPLTPLGNSLGFVPPPAVFYGWLLFMVMTYLLVVEAVKRWFYRMHFKSSVA